MSDATVLKPRISLIAAMAKHRVIGRDQSMPWHLPADLRRFKMLTLGKTILMGRATFESIGQVLPGRRSVVLTRRRDFGHEGIIAVHTTEQALEICDREEEIMVIGGAQIYAAFLDSASRMYLTLIDADLDGDTHFPKWRKGEWIETFREAHPADDRNQYAYTFVILTRCNQSDH